MLKDFSINNEFPPIFILTYQMGDQEAASIKESLREAKHNNFIGYSHSLSHNTNNHSQEQIITKHIFNKYWGKVRFKIITFVQDPISCIVSHLFTNVQKYLSHIREVDESKALNEIIISLLKTLNKFENKNDGFSGWFDSHIKKWFQFDIFKEPFNKGAGYSIYQTKHSDILVLRLEDLNTCHQKAFYEFLNIPGFTLFSINIGTNKWYAHLYQQVVNSIRFPVYDLEKMYSTKYSKHFYTMEELLNFKLKWTNQTQTRFLYKQSDSVLNEN